MREEARGREEEEEEEVAASAIMKKEGDFATFFMGDFRVVVSAWAMGVVGARERGRQA